MFPYTTFPAVGAGMEAANGTIEHDFHNALVPINGSHSGSSGRSTPNGGDPAPGKLFVGGLSWQTSSEKLREYFGMFGTVTDVLIMKDPVTQECGTRLLSLVLLPRYLSGNEVERYARGAPGSANDFREPSREEGSSSAFVARSRKQFSRTTNNVVSGRVVSSEIKLCGDLRPIRIRLILLPPVSSRSTRQL